MPESRSEMLQSKLIAHVYEAALDDTLWEGMAAQIAQAFDASSAVLAIVQPNEGVARFLDKTANFDESVVSSYEEYYNQKDLWVQRASAMGLSKVYLGQDLAPDNELERTEYYADWCRKAQVHYMMGSAMQASGELGVLGIHRMKRMGPYTEANRVAAQAFSDHLERALRIRRRLHQAGFMQRVGMRALEQVRLAVVLVDRSGQLQFVNQCASALMKEPCPVRVVANRIRLADAADHDKLLRLISEVIQCGQGAGMRTGSSMLVRRDRGFPLAIAVIPVSASNSSPEIGPCAMLLIRDPESNDIPAEVLKFMFGLTGTEAAVGNMLLNGKSVADIAKMQGVAEATVRTQVRALLTKTNTTRQGEFVSLLLGSATLLAAR